MAPEQDDAPEPSYQEQLRALEPLFRPLSEAEMAKRKRMYEGEAALMSQDDLKFFIIAMHEGWR